MNILVARLNVAIAQSTAGLLALHKLDSSAAGKINARVRENFLVRAPIDQAQAGLLGAVISGAATGLSADLMAGGLTLGVGALLGSIVGALTFAGVAWGFNSTMVRQQPSVQFSDEFLRALAVAAVLRYLAVAHFGRGRGNFVESEAPAFWQREVEQAIALNDGALTELWQVLRAEPDRARGAGLAQAIITRIALQVLKQLYSGTAITHFTDQHEQDI